jgi:hypothetical protein
MKLHRVKAIVFIVLFTFAFHTFGLANLAIAVTYSFNNVTTDNPLVALAGKTKLAIDALRNIQDGLTRGEDQTAQLAQAQIQLNELLALKPDVDVKLAEIGATLTGASPPPAVLDRHNNFVTQTNAGFTQIEGIAANLNELITRGGILPAELAPIAGALETLGPPPAPDPLGANAKLPHRRSDIEPRAIEERGAIDITAPPTSDDLAPTKDARITQEITDLAVQLN